MSAVITPLLSQYWIVRWERPGFGKEQFVAYVTDPNKVEDEYTKLVRPLTVSEVLQILRQHYKPS